MLSQRILENLLNRDKFPPTIVVYGGPFLDRRDLILEFLLKYYSKYVSNISRTTLEKGSFPDTMFIDTDNDKRIISIDDVRELIEFSLIKPFYGGKKFGVIFGGDKLTIEAQSSLLKTLEEPPESYTTIISINNKNHLFPTIRSRSLFIPIFKYALYPNDEILNTIEEITEILFEEDISFGKLYEYIYRIYEKSESIKEFVSIILWGVNLSIRGFYGMLPSEKYRNFIFDQNKEDFITILLNFILDNIYVIEFNPNPKIFLLKLTKEIFMARKLEHDR